MKIFMFIVCIFLSISCLPPPPDHSEKRAAYQIEKHEHIPLSSTYAVETFCYEGYKYLAVAEGKRLGLTQMFDNKGPIECPTTQE